MRRKEERFLQGVNLELSAFGKFHRVWPCRRKMNDVDLGTQKAQNAVAIYQAFNVAICKCLNRFVGTRKDWSAGFAGASNTRRALKGCVWMNVDGVPRGCCALTTRCTKQLKNTDRYLKSGGLCAVPQHYLTEL